MPFYDCVKRPSSSLCRLRRFKIVYFTLHYITYPGGMEGLVDLGVWLQTEMVYLSTDSYPSK